MDKYKGPRNNRMADTEDKSGSKRMTIQDKSNLDEELKLAKMSLKKSEELNDLDSMAIEFNNIGTIMLSKGDLDQALDYAKKALEIHIELDDKVRMAITYNNIGQIYQDKGDLDQALDYAKLALTIDEESKDMFQVTLDYFNLASICNLKQNDDEELVYLRKIKQLLDKVPEYSKMEYIVKRINELENKSGSFKKIQ
ncbi:MAG: tetratricopeptide repeat protein [Candidatus Nitrosocosmicus sp.]